MHAWRHRQSGWATHPASKHEPSHASTERLLWPSRHRRHDQRPSDGSSECSSGFPLACTALPICWPSPGASPPLHRLSPVPNNSMELCRSVQRAIQPPSAAGARRRTAAAQAAASACLGSRPAGLLPCQQQLGCTRLRQQRGQLVAVPRERRQQLVAAAAAVAAAPATQAAVNAFWPALVQAWNTNPSAVLLAAGACILGVALSIFLLAAIPTMLVSAAWQGSRRGWLSWQLVAS